MHYPYERKVESVIKKSAFEGRGFGAKMTVEQLIAKQTRIERSVYLVYISIVVQRCYNSTHRCFQSQNYYICRQEQPHCTSVSFDRHAANTFQSYVQSALAFSIKRGAILYGTKDAEGATVVHAIFEPPQVSQPKTCVRLLSFILLSCIQYDSLGRGACGSFLCSLCFWTPRTLHTLQA